MHHMAPVLDRPAHRSHQLIPADVAHLPEHKLTKPIAHTHTISQIAPPNNPNPQTAFKKHSGGLPGRKNHPKKFA